MKHICLDVYIKLYILIFYSGESEILGPTKVTASGGGGGGGESEENGESS